MWRLSPLLKLLEIRYLGCLVPSRALLTIDIRMNKSIKKIDILLHSERTSRNG